MICISEDVLQKAAAGRWQLSPADRAHLGGCSECRMTLAALVQSRGDTEVDACPPDESEPAWDELGPGVVVDKRFTLVEHLGSGGTGTVWSAKTPTGDEVALKIARTADPELARRFAREARILASLGHPAMLRIFEILPPTEARGPCLVCERLVGEPLDVYLSRVRTLTPQHAARVALPVASALETAHQRGVVHRDLKPSNVFYASAPAPRIVVLDFGVAKLLPAWGDHTKLTRPGALVGTPRYMAPEQVFGDVEADARVDLWALGVLLFRMLAGREPVEASGLGEIVKVFRTGKITDLAELVAVPADLLALVRGLLVMDPRSRVASLHDVRTVLLRYA